jgi:hypothetical protein
MVKTGNRETLLNKYVLSGGPLMWILVPCSLLALGAILQSAPAASQPRAGGSIRPTARLAGDPAARKTFIEGLSGLAIPWPAALADLENFDPAAAVPNAMNSKPLWTRPPPKSASNAGGLGLLATLYTLLPCWVCSVPFTA